MAFLLDHLWRVVERCSNSRLFQFVLSVLVVIVLGGPPEISYLYLSLRYHNIYELQQNIFRLDVSVNEAPLVDGINTLSYFP